MGCSASSPEIITSFDIEDQLKRARSIGKKKIRLLLLGAGESGKSTILKQMRILHGPAWTDDELRMYGVIVRSNVLVATRKLCKELRVLELEEQLATEPAPPSSPITPKQAYDELVAHLVDKTAAKDDDENSPITNDQHENDWIGHSIKAGAATNNDAQQFLRHWKAIKVLMESKTMQQVWLHHTVVNVIDSHIKFLRKVERIASPKYCPTTKDILLARARTTHVVMERYNIQGVDFEIYDIGGQRSLRHKWIDCFDHIDAVIFVAALSGYDQTLAEGKRTNRMVEALDLFRGVANHPAFKNSDIMLFLNKKDIFADKIRHSPISSQPAFNDYMGPPGCFNSGVQYFMEKFEDCIMDERKHMFFHVTCATDTKNMEFVLDSTQSIIMASNLKDSLCLDHF